jgi:hypothetical protein
MAFRQARILILCKTYPSPSGKHVETSCVAGMEEDGSLIRLFPVPFRLVGDAKQFKKWQWISARINKASNDHRSESHKVFVDTILCDRDPLSTQHGWQARRDQLKKMRVFDSFVALDAARETEQVTLGLLRPSRIVGLEIKPSDKPDWTREEKEKLVQNERQSGLFDDTDAKRIATLRKLPFDFHYRYECIVENDVHEHRHKIVDWEAGALYWKCRSKYRDEWETPFRAKLEGDLSHKELIFLMGTIHRFPEQWLIVSLIYPPRLPSGLPRQESLFASSDG